MAVSVPESPTALNVPESPFLSRLSTMTHYSPRPRGASDMFTPSIGASKGLTNINGKMMIKTAELITKTDGKRTVRLYQSYDKYFISTDVEKGKQLKIKEILNDNPYGIELSKLGIQNGWILTQIGKDEDATKLMYMIAKNRLLSLAKIGKKSGYDLTFQGKEIEINNKGPQILHSMSDHKQNIYHHDHSSHGSGIFIDEDCDFPMLPNQIDDIFVSEKKEDVVDYIPIDRGYLIVSLRLHIGNDGYIVAYKFLKYLRDENITDEMLSYDLYHTKYSWSLCETFFSEIMEYDHKRGNAIFEFMKKEALL